MVNMPSVHHDRWVLRLRVEEGLVVVGEGVMLINLRAREKGGVYLRN